MKNMLSQPKIIGHSSLDSTTRYVQPSEKDLRNAVDRLEMS
jgi:hypothetical protein